MVIDADGEKVDFVSRNFAGVADAISHFKDDLIGASGLPHTAVFGDSPSGLGAIAIATLLRTFLVVCFACCQKCPCPNLCGGSYKWTGSLSVSS